MVQPLAILPYGFNDYINNYSRSIDTIVFCVNTYVSLYTEDAHYKKMHGRFGEALAQHVLLLKNYEIIKKNYNCSYGEVDIICSKGNDLLFVEVKTWDYFSDEEIGMIINHAKRLRMERCAELFLYNFEEYTRMCVRFDVIFVQILRHTVVHYKGV